MLLTLAAVAVVVAACGNPDSSPDSSPELPVVDGEVVLADGSIEVPGADSFAAPGFHESFTLTGVVPDSAAGLSGALTIRLHDIGRPSQTCDRDHPLSGCVTVDWSDFEDRPGVPIGGVFDNRLSIGAGATATTFFMSERNGLALVPDDYSPG